MKKSIPLLCILAASSGFSQIKLQNNADLKGVLDNIRIKAGSKLLSNSSLSWRESNQKVKFALMGARAKPTKFRAIVWVLGNPKEQPHVPGAPAVLNPKVGKIANVLDLAPNTLNNEFEIDFGDFAPYGAPVMGFKVSQGKSLLGNAAAAMAESLRKEIKTWIARDGSVDFKIQVTSEDGGASQIATVHYGELTKKAEDVKTEVQTRRGTAEFPDEEWGNAKGIIAGSTSILLRSNLSAETKKVAVIVSPTPMPWPLWQFMPSKFKQEIPVSPGSKSVSVELKSLMNEPDGSKLWLTLIPIASDTELSGIPSNPILLTVINPAPTKAKPSLSFTTELVGWGKGYEGGFNDQYRFVISDPKWATSDELKKITGGTIQVGTKVYLPPAPPPKELSWYEKVADAIVHTLDVIRRGLDSMILVASTLINVLPKVPFAIAESLGLPPDISQKAYSAATAPLRLGNASLNAADRIGHVPDYLANKMLDEAGISEPIERAKKKANLMGAAIEWSRKNRYVPSSPEMLGLTLDPDYEKRTGVGYVRVTAKATGPLPAGYRQQAPTIQLSVGVWAKDDQSIGIPSAFYNIYQGVNSAGTLADGESIIVPVVTDYHWSYKSRPQDWKFGWTFAKKTLYTLNGKTIEGKNIWEDWGVAIKNP